MLCSDPLGYVRASARPGPSPMSNPKHSVMLRQICLIRSRTNSEREYAKYMYVAVEKSQHYSSMSIYIRVEGVTSRLIFNVPRHETRKRLQGRPRSVIWLECKTERRALNLCILRTCGCNVTLSCNCQAEMSSCMYAMD